MACLLEQCLVLFAHPPPPGKPTSMYIHTYRTPSSRLHFDRGSTECRGAKKPSKFEVENHSILRERGQRCRLSALRPMCQTKYQPPWTRELSGHFPKWGRPSPSYRREPTCKFRNDIQQAATKQLQWARKTIAWIKDIDRNRPAEKAQRGSANEYGQRMLRETYSVWYSWYGTKFNSMFCAASGKIRHTEDEVSRQKSRRKIAPFLKLLGTVIYRHIWTKHSRAMLSKSNSRPGSVSE